MLPKFQRLNLKKDFKWVSAGKRIDTKYMKLFIRMGDPSTRSAVRLSSPSKSRSGPLVGIAVSGQIFKKANQRNKARRITSAAFESLYAKLPSTTNIVALPKIGLLEVKSGDILLDLEEKLKSEKIVN